LGADGKELATNEHDLMIFNPNRANVLSKKMFKLAWRWMTKDNSEL
jgi:hypothetical protein